MKVSAVILAAGKGSRMNANGSKNKVVYALKGKPLITHTVSTLQKTAVDSIVVVTGFAEASVKEALGPKVTYAKQAKRLGTGHALKVGLTKVPATTSTIISLYGDDSAFYTPQVFKTLLSTHHQNQAHATVVTITKNNPTGLGRIIRDTSGRLQAIVEEKVATPAQKKITEINTGLYCFDAAFITKAVKKIQKNPISKEYYVTDVIEWGIKQGFEMRALHWPDSTIWHGINTPQELQAAQKRVKA
jgi:bifunctional UDP-N-acetylglucosamine pyrophosphorylase / glucosamine-1-phosphate N-acetyltransferase